MLKFGSDGKNGRKLIGFGLSKKNIENLLSGMPILVKCEELNVQGVDVMIFAGEDERSMMDELKKSGIGIGHQTIDMKLYRDGGELGNADKP